MSNELMLKNKRVVITGGAGFIGSHLVDALQAMGNQVTVIDNLSSGKSENLRVNSNLTFIEGDVRDINLVKKITKKSDIIFHLAEYIPNSNYGPGHVIKYSVEDPYTNLDICVKGMLNILECAKQSTTKIVYTSTAAVYGEPFEIPVKETALPNPLSPYGVSKLAAESYCKVYSQMYDMPITIARLFNVYGPRQKKYVMYDILRKLKCDDSKLEILGNGDQQRDFIYVKDVVEGLITLSVIEEGCGNIYNMGTGISTSIKQLIECMINILDVNPIINFTDQTWKGDIYALIADTKKINDIGIFPKYGVKEGVKELIKWYYEQK